VQKAVGRQKAEGRKQKAEVVGKKVKAVGRRLEAESRRQKAEGLVLNLESPFLNPYRVAPRSGYRPTCPSAELPTSLDWS